MAAFDLPTEIVDRKRFEAVAGHLKARGMRLPTFAEMADPRDVPPLPATVDPDQPLAANLGRVHWFNGRDRVSRVAVPEFIELPPELTGVKARIVVLIGRLFPMIRAHKVLAAYSCLVPRLVTGTFDPKASRALWPSTGNYCRGGVAISRILGCRGVAILPIGMSKERFDWLRKWVTAPEDIVCTPGGESDVKNIYDACDELQKDPQNVVLNQFSEFANYVGHYTMTGTAAGKVFDALKAKTPAIEMAAFVCANGSAGTIAAGDYLKDKYGARIVAVEATECPTMLWNGYGSHNIQGIGDKHIPLIHNVMNTDLVAGVSDRATDELNILFNTEVGRRYLIKRRKIDPALVERLVDLGFSGICNVLAAIKTARRLELQSNQVIVTLATDGHELYESEMAQKIAQAFDGTFDEVNAAEVFGAHLLGAATDHLIELTHRDRLRVFNLGYFTWVEQRGVPQEDFDRRKDQSFWRALPKLAPAWDKLIMQLNDMTGVKHGA